MKIIIAPDSFKESLTAPEVAEQIAAGFREVFPAADYRLLPLADGGEGTVAALVAANSGRIVPVKVTGPLGTQVDAFYGVSGDGRTAIVEMAAASGLTLVPAALRNPLLTTSYGTGELILHALDADLRHFLIGIGGSATNDCGAGMLQALGASLLDQNGHEVGFGGGRLGSVVRVDLNKLDSRLAECRIEVACDVDNPLTGAKGASAVFGPQKGATAEMVALLDENLAHFAGLLEREMGQVVSDRPGAGAAGGLGAALLALQAKLRPGIELISDLIDMEGTMQGACLVITGEGRIDGQTVYGKAPIGVARLAKRYGIPVIGIAGSLGDGAEQVHEHGIDAIFSVVCRPCSLAEALAEAAGNLRATARNIAATLRLSGHLSD
jgi:glycerate kinase